MFKHLQAVFTNRGKYNARQLEGVWRLFMDGGSTCHPDGVTVAYIMNRCEEERQPYVLTAVPGTGYHIKPKEIDDVQTQSTANGE